MRYLCVHCDHRFDHEGDKKARCPKCMRLHGIEKIGEERGGRPLPRWLWPAVAIGIVGAVVAVYLVWAENTPDTVSDEVPLRPLSLSELRGHLRRLHADAGDAVSFLDADDDVEAFAEEATDGRDSPRARAEGIVEAIRQRASKQAFVPWSMATPRDTPVRDVRRTLEQLREDSGRAHLYPLEVAAVAVAALRSVDVPAMLAEVYAFPGDRAPPEPSGHLGYFAIAVYPDEAGEGTPRVFDPYGGRGTAPEEEDFRVLSDVQALGAVLNHRAVHAIVNEGDPAAAFELCGDALLLDPRSPAIRSARGMVLLASGGTEEGLQELEAAAQLRPDAPRRNNLAGVALSKGDAETAAREVAAALEQHPDFAGGHATLAAVHLGRDERDMAERELRRAEELDPTLPHLPMLWANYYMMTHDPEQAVVRAREAIERRPHDWQTRLGAARVMREAGYYDEMREQAHRVLADAPRERAAAVRELIAQVLGPTALEEPLEDEGAEGLPGSDFQLGEDSALLGGGTGPRLGGSLLGDDDTGLLNGQDDSTLRLREPGSGLQLNLNE